MELVLATENAHKVEEFQRILRGIASVKSLQEIGFDEEMPPEVATSFRENSQQKAEFVGKKLLRVTIADDSGFEVEALGNEPGVLSARYAGTHDPSLQRQTILKKMTGSKDRRARFVCELSLYDPSLGQTQSFRGVVEGDLAHEEQGTNGFGYDPIFIPEGFDQTFGDMASEKKDQLSHRYHAIVKLKEFLEKTNVTSS